MATVAGSLLVDGLPRNGATAKLWSSGAAFLTNPPQKNTALPLTGSAVQSTTTGTTHGADGAYRFTGVTAGVYYVSLEWNSLIVYDSWEIPTSGTPTGVASVKAYGAVGDGVTNDTTAIQAALDDTAVGLLYFPPGTYLSGNLNITSRTGLVIEGQGATLDWTGTGSASAPIGLRITGTCREISIRGLRFLGDGVDTNYHAGIWSTTAAVIENLRIEANHFESLAVGCWLNRAGSGTWHGITITGNEFETTVGTGTTQGTGVFVHYESTVPVGVTINGNVFSDTTKHDIHLSRGSGLRVTENQSKSHRAAPTGAAVAAIQLGRVTDVLVRGNHIHESADGAISLSPTGGVTATRVLIAENLLTNATNAIQDINLGTTDPATDGGIDQVQVTGNVIRKSAIDGPGIRVHSGLRSRIADNQISMLTVGTTVSALSLVGAGDSGGTRTYTDDLVVAGNLLYGTNGAGTFSGIELQAGFCTSIARAEFRGNRVRGGTMFVSGTTITNDGNLQVIDQEDDGLSFGSDDELAFTETGPIRVTGAYEGPIRTVTSGAQTMLEADQVIYANAAAGSITLTLLAASGRGGRRITVIRTDTTANLVNIDPAGAETIDGVSALTLYVQWQTLSLVCDGSNWHVVSSFGLPQRGRVRTVSGTDSMAYGDAFVRCDTTAGGFTFTLGVAAEVPGHVITLSKIVDANTLTIDGAGAETIDGAATLALVTGAGDSSFNFVTLVSTGTAWLSVARWTTP